MKAVLIVIGILVLLYVLSFTMPCSKTPMSESKRLTLYYSNGCGHCKQLMPTWLDAKRAAIDGKSNVKFVEKEASEGGIPDDIQGYPTVEYNNRYYVGGKEIKQLLQQMGTMAPAQSASGGKSYTLYYANWCGYSKKILPIWEAKAAGKSNFTKVEEEEMDETISAEIDGFPVMYVDGGKEKVMGYDRIVEYLKGL